MTDYNAESDKYLVPFYTRYPIAISSGRKHWVKDVNGTTYLDFTSGISVVNFGHADPGINRAISSQIGRISHISNLFINPRQTELAKLLSEASNGGKVFFCNSGAEANEAALKISRIRGNIISPSKNRVIALNGSFHGRTIATISMTGQAKYRKGFDPILQNIDFVDINDSPGLRKKMSGDVCAIFLEAVQGEGGINMLSEAFIASIKEEALKWNSLVVFDEVQCGMGRTGKIFGYNNFNIVPDIITMAKSLGNGFPIGAAIVSRNIADSMPSGMHASTFGGNFAACAAGIAAFKKLDSRLLRHIGEISDYFRSCLEKLKAKQPEKISGLRIYGLMIGIDINPKINVGTIIKALMEKGILTLRAGENTLRLLPPFTTGKHETDIFCGALENVLGGNS